MAGPATKQALASVAAPEAAIADGLQIDLGRQLLFVVQGGAVQWVLNTSTGRQGWETPPGSYSVLRRVDGVDVGPYGPLYRPAYFYGGYAVHGSPSIPAVPASHGCARLSNAAMDMLWATGRVEPGTPVTVV